MVTFIIMVVVASWVYILNMYSFVCINYISITHKKKGLSKIKYKISSIQKKSLDRIKFSQKVN